MVSIETFKKLALSFEEVTEEKHFERISFKVRKKIFVTLDVENNLACVKLSPENQSVFSDYDNTIMYAVPNKWGKLGWTNIELKKVRQDMFKDALTLSYCGVAPKSLAQKYQND